MYRIEANVPPPPAIKMNAYRGGQGRPRIYPFDLLKKGESFSVPRAKEKTIRGSVANHNARTNKRFVARVDGRRIRIWRVK